jgi:RimJ/RimL family protein N-acetyltransferase
MTDIEYLEINLSDPLEIKRVASIHTNTPSEWIEDYKPEPDFIDKIIQKLNDIDRSLHRVIVAKNRSAEIVGIHWLEINNQEDERVGEILSLWISPSYRRKGIASKMKKMGEQWLVEKEAGKVVTKVFYSNDKMIALNLKLGFKAKEVYMEKDLR